MSLRHLRQDESGAVAIEFALILPLLLAMFFGIATFGQYFAMSNSVQQIAAEAARAAVGGLDNAERQALAEAVVQSAQQSHPLLNGSVDVSSSFVTTPLPGIRVTVTAGLAETLVDVTQEFLGLELTEIVRSSYIAF